MKKYLIILFLVVSISSIEFERENTIIRVEYNETKNNESIQEFFPSHSDSVLITAPMLAVFSNTPDHMPSMSLSNLFGLTSNGFTLLIDSSSPDQRSKLSARIQSEFGRTVRAHQIVTTKLSELKCSVRMRCEGNSRRELRSRVEKSDFPLKLEFAANESTRTCLESYLNRHGNVRVSCEYELDLNASRRIEEIPSRDIKNIRLVNSVFGDSDTKTATIVVTRHQLEQLVHEICSRSVKNYSSSNWGFSIDTFAQQNRLVREYLPLEHTLAYLSSVFLDQLDMPTIRSIYMDSLVVINASYISLKSDGRFNASLLGNLGVLSSFEFVGQQQEAWSRSNHSLSQQLAEINSHARHDGLEWTIDGQRVVPNSVFVTEMSKSIFKNSIRIELYRRCRGKLDVEVNFQMARDRAKNDTIRYDRVVEVKQTLFGLKLESPSNQPNRITSVGYFNSEIITFEKHKIPVGDDANRHTSTWLVHSRSVRTTRETSERACWLKCCQFLDNCFAISFRSLDGQCHLYKRADYLIESHSEWVSMSKNDDEDLGAKERIRTYVTSVGIGNFNSINSSDLISCWLECKRNDSCVTISFKYPKCYLFKSGTYRFEKNSNWTSISILDNGRMYTVAYEGIKLVGESIKSVLSESEETCWNECVGERNCSSVSYDRGVRECWLYTRGAYRVERSSNWTTIVFEDNKIGEANRKRHEDVQLRGVNRTARLVDSDLACWNECITDNSDCLAVSYRNGECLMYSATSFLHETRLDGWTTLAHESLSLDSVYFNRTQLNGFYAVANMTTENECWSKCVADREKCVAVSFGPAGRCHLTRRGEYRMGRFNEWTTIYKKGHCPPRLLKNATYIRSKRLYPAHLYKVLSLAILHNGYLVSGARETHIKIWNPHDGSLVDSFAAHSGPVRSLIVLHNGNLVSASDDMNIKIWKPLTASLERTLVYAPRSHAISLALLADTRFVSGHADGHVHVWSSEGQLVNSIAQVHLSNVWSLMPIQTSGRFASGGCDNLAKVWHTNGTLETVLTGHTKCVMSLAQLENGLVVTGGDDGKMFVWNPRNGKALHSYQFTFYPAALAVLPNDDLICQRRTFNVSVKSVENVSNGRLDDRISVTTEHNDTIRTFAVFSNGDFATGSYDTSIEIWKRV